MMGPFCPEQGTSSHEIVMDLASTDEIVILLADEVGAVEMRDQHKIINVRIHYIYQMRV